MNSFTLFGRVGRDPETRNTQSGQTVANFSLATDNGKNKDGDKIEPTWHNLTAWGKTADLVAKYVHKGDQLLVEGRITTSKRTVGEKEITQVNLTVNRVEFVSAGRSGDGNAKPAGAQRRSAAPAPVDDDDIPF